MASKDDKWEDNNTSKLVYNRKTMSFYVDKSCKKCGVCADIAPNNIRSSEKGDYNIVFQQPRTSYEVRQCIKAMNSCPAYSIGNDV
jgi:ferredoxin